MKENQDFYYDGTKRVSVRDIKNAPHKRQKGFTKMKTQKMYFFKTENKGNYKTSSYKMFLKLITRAKQLQIDFIAYSKTAG